jgi:hypothetical protein
VTRGAGCSWWGRPRAGVGAGDVAVLLVAPLLWGRDAPRPGPPMGSGGGRKGSGVTEKRRNPYFGAVEARTLREADEHFADLLRGVREGEPGMPEGHAREQVVAGLCYVAGYYGPDARERVRRLYAHRSSYRTAKDEG